MTLLAPEITESVDYTSVLTVDCHAVREAPVRCLLLHVSKLQKQTRAKASFTLAPTLALLRKSRATALIRATICTKASRSTSPTERAQASNIVARFWQLAFLYADTSCLVNLSES